MDYKGGLIGPDKGHIFICHEWIIPILGIMEQELFGEGGQSVLDDLRHGLYLGSEEFAQECLKRAEGEAHREKPQFRALLRGRDPRAIAVEVLDRLGENDPGLLLGVRRVRSINRDLAIYALYQLGVYRNEEIGRVFGVGYTAVTAAVKRARKYLKEDSRLQMIIKKTLNDK